MHTYYVYLDAALLAVIAYHLALAPYTKVEESFTTQSVHDILNYGVLSHETVLESYDHIRFPGAVPRTFVGSLVLAGGVKSLTFVAKLFGVDFFADQSQSELAGLLRTVLGIANGAMLIKLRNSVAKIGLDPSRKLPKPVARTIAASNSLVGFWFSVLLLSQFHLLYYASRTLPNFVALPPVLYAFAKLVEGDMTGLTWLAFTGAIFRLEIGILAGIIALVSSLGFGQSNVFSNTLLLVTGALFGALISTLVDSFFWNKVVYPELAAFLFNVVEGNSAHWGTEPWSAYFNGYLQQLFRPPVILLLAAIGLLTDPIYPLQEESEATESIPEQTPEQTSKSVPETLPRAKNSLRILFFSAVLYISVMSFQPHKEWRFIIYTAPLFTLVAANGLAGISQKWDRGFSSKLLNIVIVSIVALSAVLSLFMGYISSYNYPGGEALTYVNDYIETNYLGEYVMVHMDVPACMSGINRFGELKTGYVTYDKTEGEHLADIWNDISILVTADPLGEIDTANGSVLVYNPANWQKVHSVPAFRSVTIFPIVSLVRESIDNPEVAAILLESIVEELKELQFDTLSGLFRSLVITEDSLHIYERKAKDSDFRIDQRLTEPELVHEIDPEQVKEAINDDIDSFENNN